MPYALTYFSSHKQSLLLRCEDTSNVSTACCRPPYLNSTFLLPKLADLTPCVRRIMDDPMWTFTASISTWRYLLSQNDCEASARVVPIPGKEFSTWVRDIHEINMTANSRLSRYCLDEDYFNNCNYKCPTNGYGNGGAIATDVTNNTIENESEMNHDYNITNCNVKESCLNGKIDNYHICRNGLELRRCDECESCMRFSSFDANTLDIVFSDTLRFPKPGISLVMLFDSRRDMTTVYFQSSKAGRRFRSSANCSQDGDARSNHSEDSEMCFYPYPLTNECLTYPCRMTNLTEFQRGTYWENIFSEKILYVSTAALLITIILHLTVSGLKTNFSYYQINYYVTYLMSNVFFLVSATVGAWENFCIGSAMILHYLLLASFTWMLITSSLVLRRFYMINRLISPALLVPYNENRPKSEYVKCHLLGHLMPAILVGCCVLCDIFLKTGTTPYGSLPFCWIKNERTLLMAFILPSGLLLFLNALVCIVCCLLLLHVRAQNHRAQLSSLGNGWTLFILTKLLFGSGIQWAFGLLAYFYPKDEIIRFPFIVLVSVHGTLILIATLSLKVMRRKIENALHKISQTSIVVIVRGNRSNAVISITT